MDLRGTSWESLRYPGNFLETLGNPRVCMRMRGRSRVRPGSPYVIERCGNCRKIQKSFFSSEENF